MVAVGLTLGGCLAVAKASRAPARTSVLSRAPCFINRPVAQLGDATTISRSLKVDSWLWVTLSLIGLRGRSNQSIAADDGLGALRRMAESPATLSAAIV